MVELDDHGGTLYFLCEHIQALLVNGRKFGIKYFTEKLDSIETGLVNVNKDMEQAKQHLKGLGVLDGLIPKFLK